MLIPQICDSKDIITKYSCIGCILDLRCSLIVIDWNYAIFAEKKSTFEIL